MQSLVVKHWLFSSWAFSVLQAWFIWGFFFVVFAPGRLMFSSHVIAVNKNGIHWEFFLCFMFHIIVLLCFCDMHCSHMSKNLVACMLLTGQKLHIYLRLAQELNSALCFVYVDNRYHRNAVSRDSFLQWNRNQFHSETKNQFRYMDHALAVGHGPVMLGICHGHWTQTLRSVTKARLWRSAGRSLRPTANTSQSSMHPDTRALYQTWLVVLRRLMLPSWSVTFCSSHDALFNGLVVLWLFQLKNSELNRSLTYWQSVM